MAELRNVAHKKKLLYAKNKRSTQCQNKLDAREVDDWDLILTIIEDEDIRKHVKDFFATVERLVDLKMEINQDHLILTCSTVWLRAMKIEL